MPFCSRQEATPLQQMAHPPQMGHRKKNTATMRRESQARGKLHTQNRSHGSLSRASQRLSRLPLRLRQEPQILVTDFLFHQKHQVTVQLPVQRRPIVVLISIYQIKKSPSTKLQSIMSSKQLGRSPPPRTPACTCDPWSRFELQQLLFPLVLQVLNHDDCFARASIVLVGAFLPPPELLLLLQLADFMIGVAALLHLYLEEQMRRILQSPARRAGVGKQH